MDAEKNRSLVRRKCLFCNETFWSKRADAQFDSARCRIAYYRWRKRLPMRSARAIAILTEMGVYIDFRDSSDLAVEHLVSIRRQIKDILREHGISVKD